MDAGVLVDCREDKGCGQSGVFIKSSGNLRSFCSDKDFVNI